MKLISQILHRRVFLILSLTSLFFSRSPVSSATLVPVGQPSFSISPANGDPFNIDKASGSAKVPASAEVSWVIRLSFSDDDDDDMYSVTGIAALEHAGKDPKDSEEVTISFVRDHNRKFSQSKTFKTMVEITEGIDLKPGPYQTQFSVNIAGNGVDGMLSDSVFTSWKVPEPLTVFGSLLALGIGATLKKESSKKA